MALIVAVGAALVSVVVLRRLLAALLESWEEADRHFEDALAMNERMGARPWLAHTQEDYGRMLLARGRAERGSELVEEALATYRRLGMEGALQRASTAAVRNLKAPNAQTDGSK